MRCPQSHEAEQNQKKRTFDVLPKPDKLIRYRHVRARSCPVCSCPVSARCQFVPGVTFVPGVYDMGDLYTGAGDLMTLSDTNLPIPEPSSWAMMLLGYRGVSQGKRGRVASRSAQRASRQRAAEENATAFAHAGLATARADF